MCFDERILRHEVGLRSIQQLLLAALRQTNVGWGIENFGISSSK